MSLSRWLAIAVLWLTALACAGPAWADVTIETVTVGDPGNSADGTGYGAVGYVYQIGKYDVTLAQYTAFLNAVATVSDPYGLYNSGLATNFTAFGIARNGSPGSYSYAVIGSATRRNDMPVFDVSWGDAARFCNWLCNGQPSAPGTVAGPGTTETGAYTLNGANTDSALIGIVRNSGATYFIPSENEWYKAAYYKSGPSAGYWKYPTQSDSTPSNVLSSTGTNNANCWNLGYTSSELLTPVGAFTASPGPYGTYDQGGDVWQWNEAITNSNLFIHGKRGGSYQDNPNYLGVLYRDGSTSTTENPNLGFRVAAVPEPGSVVLGLFGVVGLLIYAWRRRAC